MAANAEQPIEFFPLKQVELIDGPLADSLRLNRDHLLQYEPDRLLAPFLEEAGLEPKAPRYPNWESMGLGGHTAGHYLSALAATAAALDDPQCRERLGYMVGELARCQQAGGDGYVGGVPRGRELWEAIAGGQLQASSFSLGDRWVPLYNLHKTFAGLRDAYLVAGNEQAREVFIGLCGWCDDLFSPLSDEQLQAVLATEHGGMNEVLADAAAISGEDRFLKLARRFCHRALLDPLAAGQDRLSGMHANTQVPKVIGFHRVGELQDDARLRDAALFFWRRVAEQRSVAFGGNSVSEHFPSDDQYQRFIEHREGPETCNTYNMLRLTERLFAERGESRFMDFYERALFNHILSTQHPEHGGYVYFTPCRPRHYRVYSQPGVAFWCCVGTGMENHSRHGSALYAHRGDELFVNLFAHSRVDWADQGAQVLQTTRFPDEPRTSLEVTVDEPKRLVINVRRPAWAAGEGFAVRVNGEPWNADTNAAGYVAIDRTWHSGDRVEVDLPMQASVETLPNLSEYTAVMYGPIVLAAKTSEDDLDGLVAGDGRMEHVAAGPLRSLNGAPVLAARPDQIAEKVERVDTDRLRFRVADIVRPDEYRDLELIPLFRLHDARYVVYWKSAPAEDGADEQMAAAEEAKLALDRATVDRVTPGQQQPEAEHNFRGEDTQIGGDGGQSFRNASGWFSYDLNPRGEKSLTLQVTYRASDDRGFRLTWNGQPLPSSRARQRREGDLRVVEYRLTGDEVAKPATLRFTPDQGAATPDFVDVRLLRREDRPPAAVLPGVNADPHVAFFGDRCYLYPTTDGTEGWRSTSFQAWSSADMVNWRNEGVILDLPRDLKWADIHAWAPAIATKNGKYYYYYSANKNIGVAVADRPEGPFRDPLGKPLVSARDYRGMQAIDPMVFVDDDNQAYLYWGQGRCKAVPLADDMISFDPAQVRDITPPGYNEGPFVHKRDGRYYLSWSEYDTRDPRYSVAYGVADSPLGKFKKAADNPILKQSGKVRGAGHHSIGKVPGRDQWVIAYHRFRIPGGDGYNRETCLSPLRHAEDGAIQRVDVFETVEPIDLSSLNGE
ncbi:Arabinoxylan arabinofuranohydrolase precursor [Posidoniimonas corsicana]|uniref:Arabinoxylan arabinofuranohydrolase n=1 Tax=Posidoniimonas corsicana TaxID=1938618 RepID=A0A5C5VB62_9BACT|nr:beta-L-arabinofuranosidase domain-containing protein [Posidoniimonas corsicana]TWT35866.1 Arabinoxylan arabinofuranohydrolase precursor [Posidoniimonas corsicana]